MICLFIYFVVVVFPIFGASEDFRDSEKVVILWFLKAIRKAQDNISKLQFRKNNQPLGKKRNIKVNIISAIQSRLF